MSTYCTGCRFDPKQRTGEDACPLNALYWDFIARHETRFAKNPRMSMPVMALRKFPEAERAAIAAQARLAVDKLSRGNL
jgi:deoxyribodipyrimidine photolyase-related protein